MGKVISTLLAVAIVATTYRVYDRQGKLVEIWEDKGTTIEIYGPDMSRKGHIEKGLNSWSRFDKGWNREASIERADSGPVTLDRIEK